MPVPPWRRVVEASTWRKRSKIRSSSSGGIPMPESCTETHARSPVIPTSTTT